MNTISAVVIAKNEEKIISDCLASVTFCDEIVMVDDGSTDQTVEIVKKYTDKIFHHKGVGYVEAVRKFAIQKATSDWVIVLDADEQVTPELAKEIRNVINDPTNEYAAFTVTRRNYYLGKHAWPAVDVIERVFRKDIIDQWDWKLHTSPVIKGTSGKLEGELNHYTHQTLTSMLTKTIIWSKVEAELRLHANHPPMTWWRFPRVMISAFFDSYIKQRGFKAGTAGFVESMYQAFSMFITYARLWEMQQEKKTSSKVTSR